MLFVRLGSMCSQMYMSITAYVTVYPTSWMMTASNSWRSVIYPLSVQPGKTFPSSPGISFSLLSSWYNITIYSRAQFPVLYQLSVVIYNLSSMGKNKHQTEYKIFAKKQKLCREAHQGPNVPKFAGFILIYEAIIAKNEFDLLLFVK